MTQLTGTDRADMIEATIINYRDGDIGPLKFVSLLRALGVPADECEILKNRHRDECAENRK